MTYQPRIIDSMLERLLSGLPAVAIDGAKGVGKTETASRLAGSIVALDDEGERELTRGNPARLGTLAPPVLLDEWQLLPQVWDRVRRSVDAHAPAGSFILTGSASPHEAPTHTGAGRIVRLRMRPMSLAERGLCPPTVSLAQLLSGEKPAVGGESPVTVSDYTKEITASGFPGIRSVPDEFRNDLMDGYLTSIVEREFEDSGATVRRPTALRAWMAAYAAATSSVASYSAILDAATYGESEKPARTTTTVYRNLLERMWLLDEVPAWVARQPFLTSLAKTPKHHLADPALAARLLGVSTPQLLNEPNPVGSWVGHHGTLLGAFFEGLVTLSVQTYAGAAKARVYHLRTARGEHEVDLIVERDDGRIVALEVKLAPEVNAADVKHLLWLRDQLGDDLLDAAVITTGPGCYRRADGIAVVPAALLGP
ncbi:MAG: DUF4143 domain-containing protein [Propionibacteriaceae bacterium]|jgi:predicted AAA+ superfamily ATPase|nr:DUF4143 domain-containing protein [Propionibacteriaceae bacterium]